MLSITNRNICHYHRAIPIMLVFAYVISGCSEADPDLEEEILEGISQQQIFSWEKDQDKTFLASTLSDTGSKVLLVGGDTLIAETPTYRSLLKPDTAFTFYFAEHPENLQDQTIDFSIDYLPLETRSERWYPVDEAYVDIGPGSYTYLTWQNTIQFPEAPTLHQPVNERVYNSRSDRVNITWDANLQGEDNVQIWAAFDCYQQSFKIYPDETDPVTNNGFSISIDDLFDAVNYRSYDGDNFNLTQDFIDILFYGKIDTSSSIFNSPEDCRIRIHAFVQKIESTNEPFVSGNVYYHHSHTKTIVFTQALR